VRQARWATRSLTPYDGAFASEEALVALSERLAGRAVSATYLESYAECPYRYLMGEVLRLRPLEEPERITRIDALTKGSVVHRILQRFIAGLRGPLTPTDAPAHREALLAILEEELANTEASGLTGSPLLWRADRTEIVDDLLAWLDLQLRATAYTHSEVEVAFGTSFKDELRSDLARDEPLLVELGRRSFLLKGVIDRIDYEPGGAFRVIDYKTGKGSGLPKEGELNGGRALQLPLYVLAGGLLLGVSPSNGEAAYHVVSRRGQLKQILFTGGALEARRNDLEQVLDRILAGIEAGDFHPQPADDTCRYCDFKRLCDVGRTRIHERKQDDERVESFKAMREIA
jgi:RecB family exonuclease